jgi:DnaD/phage-associated family protein
MNNQARIFDLIKQISGQANVLTIPRLFVKLTGDLKAALLLSQCIYWSDKTKRTDGFFYKTAAEFAEEIGMSRHELTHARQTLERLGFLETDVKRADSFPTLHWRVNLRSIVDALATPDLPESGKTVLPETGKTEMPKSGKTLTVDYNIDSVVVVAAPTAPKPDQQPEPIPDRPNIYALYERAIGPLTPALLPHLDAAAETYAPEWVASAFDEAAKNNGRSWSYVRAILEAWQRNGFKVDGRQKQTQTNAPRRGGRKTFAQLKAELEAWAAQGD